MDLWLLAPNGHVIGFTLPLHPTIDRQWREGHLTRVNEDGTPYDGGVPGEGAATAPGGDTTGGEPVRPAANAPKGQWAAYAEALGLDVDPKATKADLVDMTTPPETDPGA